MEPCRKSCRDFDAHTCVVLVDCHASIVRAVAELRETLGALRELQVEMMSREASNWDADDGSEI